MLGAMLYLHCFTLLALCQQLLAGPAEIDVLPGWYKVYTMPDAHGRAKPARITDPLIVQISIQGTGRQDLAHVKQTIYQLNNTFLKDFKLCGMLLQINAAGGSQAYKMLHEIDTFAKHKDIPVFAYCNGLLLDQANIVSCAAEKIYAAPGAVCGIIGTIATLFNVRDNPTITEQIGEHSTVEAGNPVIHTISSATNRGLGDQLVDWTAEELVPMSQALEESYNFMLDTLLLHRQGTNRELLIEVGSGELGAAQAQAIGLIDVANTTRAQALSDLVARARCSRRYKVIELLPE